MKKGLISLLFAFLALSLAFPATARHKNFNDQPVDIRLVGNHGQLTLTDLETGESANPAMTIKPHSYRAFSYR